MNQAEGSGHSYNKYCYRRWVHKGQWQVSVFTVIAENSRLCQWTSLFTASEQLLYTQTHLCLSPAPQKSLLLMEPVMCKKLLVWGLTQHPWSGPNWTKSKLALLSLNRKVRITASAIPLPGTHPRSRAESPSSRWLSECLSYRSRWHCSNLMQESF